VATNEDHQCSESALARLVSELVQAEAYEQALRQLIMDIRDQLAAGNVGRALSMLNGALSQIDNAADVVAPTERH